MVSGWGEVIALKRSGGRKKKQEGPSSHGQREFTSEGRIATASVSNCVRVVVGRVRAQRAESDFAQEARAARRHTARKWA